MKDPQWSMDNSSIASNVITWSSNKTDMYNCLRYKITEINQTRSITWSYRNCSAKFVAACQVEEYNMFISFLLLIVQFGFSERFTANFNKQVSSTSKGCKYSNFVLYFPLSDYTSYFFRIRCSLDLTRHCLV
jgi:hypothetical protein